MNDIPVYEWEFRENYEEENVFPENPVSVRRLPSGKYRVRHGGKVSAYATTEKKAKAQARLLRGLEHGMVPRSNPGKLLEFHTRMMTAAANKEVTYNDLMDIALTRTGGNRQTAQLLVDSYLAGAALAQKVAKQKGKVIPFKRNPPVTKIYQRCIQIFASKAGMQHHCDAACKRAGHRYQHKFKKSACIYGLADGSLLIK